jgi:predicted glycogen debranching enzyme
MLLGQPHMTDDTHTEWLEADGLGGFASGTVSGIRTRRYHALLLGATAPPGGRVVLVNGMEAWVTTPAGRFALSTQMYVPDVVFPDGSTRFTADPWPCWTFELPDAIAIEQEIFVPHGHSACVVTWRAVPGANATLEMRPLLSGRDYHGTHHENGAFRFQAEQRGPRVAWRPYDGVPAVEALTNGEYQASPEWYRRFLYTEEQGRGLDCIEDLASPGLFRWQLGAGDAVCLFATAGHALDAEAPAGALVASLRRRERARRSSFASPLHRAADAYVVTRGRGRTIVAGYPWFADWGRDTFIAIRGICLAAGRLDDARSMLIEWAGAVSDGMLPNRFGDDGNRAEFNAVDASLWYVVAVHEYLQAIDRGEGRLTGRDRETLQQAVAAILTGYAGGTRYGIRVDADGLLACGEPGVQLTWMDARVGERVITPRIGKPVEVQALWLNALHAGAGRLRWCGDMLARGAAAFEGRFWNPAGYLNDVVDADHVAGAIDDTLRPNQILALGGLPLTLVGGPRAARVLQTLEEQLLTPLGLRSLSPEHQAYVAHYRGGVPERDGAYHQGTVWPWLIGPFVEAWLRVHGATPDHLQEARDRFIAPLRLHLSEAGLGHVSEIADAAHPFTPRGCPFQAWSVGELLRLEAQVLRQPEEGARVASAMLPEAGPVRQ